MNGPGDTPAVWTEGGVQGSREEAVDDGIGRAHGIFGGLGEREDIAYWEGISNAAWLKNVLGGGEMRLKR